MNGFSLTNTVNNITYKLKLNETVFPPYCRTGVNIFELVKIHAVNVCTQKYTTRNVPTISINQTKRESKKKKKKIIILP